MGHTRVVAVVVVALAVALAVPAAGQPDGGGRGDAAPKGAGPTEQATEDVARAELAALDRARSAVGAAMSRSSSAEYTRARAEHEVVVAHRERRMAQRDRDRVVAMLELARAQLSSARAEQARAQEHFDDGVALAYKFGGAQATSLVLNALQSASDVHDLARAMNELDGVLGHSYEDLGRRTRAAVAAEARVGSLARLAGVARAALAEAAATIPPLEEAAQAAREAAAAGEVGVLDAAAYALDAEQAVLDAVEEAEEELELELEPPRAAADPLSPGSATVDGEHGPSVELRRAWLGNRRATVAAAQRLDPRARRLRPGLTCPVEGGTFSNDFHLPRSHGRRHLGTDVFADRGTPVVALARGVVTRVDTVDTFDGDHDLGGITVSWETGVGRFYAAHLDGVADLAVGDEVRAGEVVGFVGDSGNAAGTPPHLHLGWYVDDVPVNPWPTLALVCDAEDQGPR